MEKINWNDFSKVDMRVGTILEVADFPKARKPAYQLQIDFGATIGVLKSSAQITTKYQPDELVGRQIIAVVNFREKQIANFMSQCLVMGVMDQDDVILLAPERKVKNGLKIG